MAVKFTRLPRPKRARNEIYKFAIIRGRSLNFSVGKDLRLHVEVEFALFCSG